MRKFTSDGNSYTLTGRDWRVIGFTAEQMPEDLYDPCQLKGETVEIDDKPHEVCAVESFCIPRSPDHPYRLSFGLAVL